MHVTVTALRTTATFLHVHPEVAELAYITASQSGRVTIQMGTSGAPEDVRTGIVMGLAFSYSGDLRRDVFAGDYDYDGLVVDMVWRDQPLHIWTPVKKHTPVSA